MALHLERVDDASEGARTLWNELIEGSRGLRGAHAILDDLGDVEGLIDRRSLWIGREGEPVSLAVLEQGIVKVLYVARGHRRRGVGRATLAELLVQANPVDAWALPGDRASKSLYESVGWRARLLTMRGD